MTKILVIEDETTIRANICSVLRFEDFEVIEAPNGEIGIQQATKEHPNLIICDIMMPGVDGYGVLDALRNTNGLGNIPFIFLTAKSDKSDLRKGMVLGADDYLTKPFTSQELLEAVRSRIKRQTQIADSYEASLENAKKVLTQMVAHELRTPLVPIAMVKDVVTRHTDSLSAQQLQELMETLGSGTQRLMHVVDQIVLYTQLESGSLSAPSVAKDGMVFSAKQIVEEALKVAVQRAKRNKALANDLEAHIEDMNLKCDRWSLQHAIAELVLNAIHFSRQKVPQVEATLQDSQYRIRLIDDGIGIDPDDVSAALEPFTQIDRSSQEQQGIGLGLTLAKRVVEIHGGTLKIGKGNPNGTIVEIAFLAR